ncbi:MAG: glycosyltransferase family 9 protein [Candidatus Omnitrophica bacterium]|nr:glycosyltransferase family 9 protein [Candidatus Omnitrophota bacterium]
MQIEKKAVRNILVVRNDRFGEFLLNIPVFRALKETFVSAKIIAVVDPTVEGLARALPYLDQTIAWGTQGHSWKEKLQLIRLLKREKINIAIMLNPSKEFNLLTYLARIPLRVGYNRKWGFLLTHKMSDKKALGLQHEVEYNLELAGLIGARTSDNSLTLEISENLPEKIIEEARLNENTDFVILHPWTSDALKLWPKENFLGLAKLLHEELKLKVIIVGGPENLNSSVDFLKAAENPLIDLTGKTSLRQLALLLKRAKLLVSADSGPVHLACAMGTPVIALFRNDLPGKTAKRWGPWGKNNRVIERDGLAQISAKEVLFQVKEILKR